MRGGTWSGKLFSIYGPLLARARRGSGYQPGAWLFVAFFPILPLSLLLHVAFSNGF